MDVPESLRNKRILIVDDFAEMRDIFNAILSFNGFLVTEARSGQEALDLFHENPFDLIILDLFMPGMHGIDVIENLIKDYPDIKIIAISGGGEDNIEKLNDFLEEANYTGAKRSLHKPCPPEELMKSVVDVLSESDV